MSDASVNSSPPALVRRVAELMSATAPTFLTLRGDDRNHRTAQISIAVFLAALTLQPCE